MTAEEFQKLIDQCQPQPNFKNDWKTFYPIDFAESLLPNVPCYIGKAVEVYDGADLFAGLQKSDQNFYQVTDSNNLISIYMYTYPKGVLAGERKDAIQPGDNNVCVFIELSEDESISVFFRMGAVFKNFLDGYYQSNKLPGSSLAVGQTEHKTDAEKFKQQFNKTISHYNMMEFVLKTIGINQAQTFQNNYNAKLQRLLQNNNIASFIYANVLKSGDSTTYVTIAARPGKQGLEYAVNTTDTKPQTPEQYLAIKKTDNSPTISLINSKTEPLASSPTAQNAEGKPEATNGTFERIYAEFNKNGFNESPSGQQGKQAQQGAQQGQQGQMGGANALAEIAQQVSAQLSNPFYSDVKVLVKIKQEGQAEAQTSPSANKPIDNVGRLGPLLANAQAPTSTAIIGDVNNYDVGLDIAISANGGIKIKHRANPNYLNEYLDKWKKEAAARELEVDIEGLKQQVLADFESQETEQSFYNKFIQGVNAAISDKIASYAEGVQATQKVARHIWSDGTINESIWYPKDEEYTQWPEYIHTPPIVGGAVDGVIDEIIGLPMAVKGVYEIATEKEKREALAAVFTEEGFGKLINGLKEELVGDKEKVEHTAGQTAVSVAAMFSGAGFITKTGKVGDVLSATSKVDGAITNQKVLRVLKEIRDMEGRLPTIIKDLEEFLQGIDPKIMDKLADAPGFEKAIQEMAYTWNHLRGGKFVLEHAGKMIGEGKVVKFAVKSLDGEANRIYDIAYEVIEEGRKVTKNIELKNWARFFPDTIKKQFIKDLENMGNLGSHVWIFSKKGDIQDIDVLRGNIIGALKKADGKPIDELSKLFDDPKIAEKYKLILNRKENVTAAEFLEELNKKEIFEQIFEIVE